jgi:hypothetical protein
MQSGKHHENYWTKQSSTQLVPKNKPINSLSKIKLRIEIGKNKE